MSVCLSIKICLYQTYIVPVLLYGCKTWSTTKLQYSRIDAFDIVGTLQDPEDTIYSSCDECGSQSNHRMPSSLPPGH